MVVGNCPVMDSDWNNVINYCISINIFKTLRRNKMIEFQRDKDSLLEYQFIKKLDLNKPQLIVDLHCVLQGEGKFMGVPHILIRFSGCNMNCMFSDWLCDTSYASWHAEGTKYSINDVIELLYANPHIDHIMITGGEPFLNKSLLHTITHLIKTIDTRYWITVETNGTMGYFDSKNEENLPIIDFISMSPKLKNSVPIPGTTAIDPYVSRTITEQDKIRHEEWRTNYKNMNEILDHCADFQLKFVVTTEDQIEEIETVRQALGVDMEDTYLMPEGVTANQLAKRRQWVMEKCIEKGYKYSDRLHIVCYGNARTA